MGFVSCSVEVRRRGLLGSKAYVRDHKEELEKIVLNINLGYDRNLPGQVYLPVFPQRISWFTIFPIWRQKPAFL